jgi:hypothetical protein
LFFFGGGNLSVCSLQGINFDNYDKVDVEVKAGLGRTVAFVPSLVHSTPGSLTEAAPLRLNRRRGRTPGQGPGGGQRAGAAAL